MNCLELDSIAFNKGNAPVCLTVLFLTGARIPLTGPMSTPIPALRAVMRLKAYSDAKIDSVWSPILILQQELYIFIFVRTPLIIGVGRLIKSSLSAVYIFKIHPIGDTSSANITIAISINVS